MTIVYILIALAVLVGVLFAALRKKPEAQLPPKPEAKAALPEAKPKAKPEAKRGEEPARRPVAPSPAPGEAREAPKPSPAPGPTKPVAAKPKPRGDVNALRKGLAASRTGFIGKLRALIAGKKEIDPTILEQMEEVMLGSDVGVKTTQAILGRLRDRLDRHELGDEDAVWTALRAEALEILGESGGGLQSAGKPTVVLMVGVNGVGKTTTIGKLATRARDAGLKTVLAAGDTFRAGATSQLEVWAKRVGAELVRGKEGGDPGAVAFEATTKARELGADVLFVDTAGRLHTKAPLMDEIKKVRKTIAKALDGAPHETLLVLDATTGQNALTQAAMFKEAVDLTGIILTKLDGTAKGGIVLGICDELKVPVRYIGLGERAEDLREFVPEDFVEALFGREAEEAAAE